MKQVHVVLVICILSELLLVHCESQCRFFLILGSSIFFRAGFEDRKEKAAWDELEPTLYRIHEEAISIRKNVL